MTVPSVPLISVLVPVYNAAAFLPACLDGILGQTYPHFEVICVDDASRDDSLAILHAYAKRDRRVKVFPLHPGVGVAQARNKLLELAAGEYVAFVDADDRIRPDYLKRLLETARQTGADVVRCLYDLLNTADGSQTPCEQKHKEFLRPAPGPRPVCRLQAALDDSQVWLKLIKTSLIKANHIGFVPKILTEDIAFEILLYQYAQKPVFISDHLYLYRVSNPLSLSANKARSFCGTLQGMIWLCRELPRRRLTDASLCGRMALLTFQAVRRVRKYPMPEEFQIGALCREAVAAVETLLPYCRLWTRWRLALFCKLARRVPDEKLPGFARWIR